MDRPLRIVIADDHAYFLDGLEIHLRNFLQNALFYRAGNGFEILNLTKKYTPDLIITDIEMPQLNGIQTIKRLNREYPELPVAVVTEYYDMAHIKPLLNSGIRVIMDKVHVKQELPEGFKALWQKKDSSYFSRFVQPVVTEIAKGRRKTEGYKGITPKLTTREYQLLPYLAKGLTNREIAQQTGKSPHTIDTHRSNIYHKFTNATREKVNNAAKLALKAREMGYVE